jgi:hypothetical protein
MIEAILEHPGFLRICDSSNESHIVAASVISSVTRAGPNTSYLSYRGGKTPIFVGVPAKAVKAELKRAKTLRREPRQLSFDFGEKREASAVTPTPQITQPPEESKVVSGGS